MEFCEAFKRVRNEKRYTQQAIADALMVSKGAVASWESGARKPDIDTICKLADFYGVSTDYLLGRIEIKKETPPAEVAEGMKRVSVTLPLQPTKEEADSAIQALVRRIVRQELGLPDNQQ